MNLIKEAIQYFSGKQENEVGILYRRKYYYLASKALEKRLPMKVDYKKHIVTEFPYCPSCGESLHKHSGQFCLECGQHIQW